ncbi:protein CREG1-like [Phymastichus coffea]|uniref:protein CREG1-like n=1 Tax=Phymastichus coffea TaxID=108790 RepID=UPI00273AD663|nr:protein CREG1-like [Phymastichus coffea]
MFAKISIVSVVILAALASSARLPPSSTKHALMARYIVNEAEWTSIATISVNKKIKGYPFANLKSVADGAIGKGNGIPYLFLTPLDFSVLDLAADPRATFMMSLAQGDYCHDMGFDPMDPRCGRVILTGKVKKIEEDDVEHEVAENAVFTRHPWLKQMPPNHKFFFAKLDIENIVVLAQFGDPQYVNVKEYFDANGDAIEEYAKLYR